MRGMHHKQGLLFRDGPQRQGAAVTATHKVVVIDHRDAVDTAFMHLGFLIHRGINEVAALEQRVYFAPCAATKYELTLFADLPQTACPFTPACRHGTLRTQAR